jgi:hypothetical protein
LGRIEPASAANPGRAGFGLGIVRAATAASDFRLEDLRHRRTAIYLALDPGDIDLAAGLVRVTGNGSKVRVVPTRLMAHWATTYLMAAPATTA